MDKQGDAYVNGANCNAIPLAHWPVRQKLKPYQYIPVQLRYFALYAILLLILHSDCFRTACDY